MKSIGWLRPAAAAVFGSVLAGLVPTTSAFAYPYSAVVVYGDALSDNGNFFAATGVPGAPYYNGRRSDGPVAVEQLAVSLGAPLIDFAWIGATTGVGNYGDGGTVTSLGGSNLPGMGTVFNLTQPLLASGGPYNPLVADSLFVVWGGPADVLAPSPLDTSPLDIINRAVANELAIINGLQALGAQHFLVPGMPDLGLTPYFRSLGAAAAAAGTAFTDAFNLLLQSELSLLPYADDVMFFDTATLFRAVVDDPGAYGFTNATDPCFDGTTVCANPGEHVFFDDFHPTTASHAVLAREFAAAVPEPGTLALVSITLVGLVWSRRHHAGKTALR